MYYVIKFKNYLFKNLDNMNLEVSAIFGNIHLLHKCVQIDELIKYLIYCC